MRKTEQLSWALSLFFASQWSNDLGMKNVDLVGGFHERYHTFAGSLSCGSLSQRYSLAGHSGFSA